MKTRKPAGKAGAKERTTPERATPERAKLEKELRAAIAEVDEKGLLFLLRQAQVLIHNARVERIGEGSTAGTEKEQESAPRPAAPRPAAPRSPQTVSIEDGEGGKTIFLNIGRARKVLAPEEMKRLVRICYGAETKSEALHQLFTVLVKERRDILSDAMIGSPDNELLRGLFTAIREKYQLPDR